MHRQNAMTVKQQFSEIAYGVATLILFAGLGVLLAWRG